LDLDGWRELQIGVIDVDAVGNMLGVNEELFNVLDIDKKSQKKILALLTKARNEVVKYQKKSIKPIKPIGSVKGLKVATKYEIPTSYKLESKWRRVLWDESVLLLGVDKAAFFVDSILSSADSVSDLQGFGGVSIVAEIEENYNEQGGVRGYIDFYRDHALVDSDSVWGMLSFVSTKQQFKLSELKTVSEEIELTKLMCKDVKILPNGKLFLPASLSSYVSYSLVNRETGRLDVKVMNAMGLKPSEQVRLENLIEGKRREFAEIILKSRKIKKDQFGNLLVEIPDNRAKGKIFRTQLYESIFENFDKSVSIHFKGLVELVEHNPAYSIERDWFMFGEPVTYIVRGGVNDERRGEIPEGEIWLQKVPQGETLESGYDLNARY